MSRHYGILLSLALIVSMVLLASLVLTVNDISIIPLQLGLSELASRIVRYSYCNCINSSLSLAIVNAILWDFRGIDTFFETTVLFIAVIGGWIVYKNVFEFNRTSISGKTYSLIVETITKLSLVIAFIVSLALALNGHLSPGGGFQGGVLFSTAIIVLIVVNGLEWLRRNLLPPYRALSLRTIGLMGIFSLAFLPLLSGLIHGYVGFVFQNQAKPPLSFFNLYYEVGGVRYSLIILLYNVFEYVAVTAAFTLVFYTIATIVFREEQGVRG